MWPGSPLLGDGPASVAVKTGNAERVFGDIIDQLKESRDSRILTISVEAVVDVLDKFRLWAGNIGARNAPDSSFSLESRLVSASELLEQVAELLDDLVGALEDLLEIASGVRENRTITVAHQTGETGRDRDEAHDILDVASECIRSLLRISILIRKATPRDRFAKAMQAAGSRRNPFLDQFDISHVAERYPKLNRPDTRWLCDRLGRAITNRRQFLRYSREHRLRVAGSLEWSESQEEDELTKSILAKNAFVVSHDRTGKSTYSAAVSKVMSTSDAALTRPSTKASTLDVTKLDLLAIQRPQDDTRSYVSAKSSFQMTGTGDTTLRLPTLHAVSQGEVMFECPFCFGIQTISKEWAWQQHAFQDLKAYVCTLGGTECDAHIFADSRTWFDHELQSHRRHWICILCQAGPFKASQQMEAHTKTEHGNILVHQSQLQTISNASQRAVDTFLAGDCPFCDEWAEALKAETPVPDGVPASNMVVTVDSTQFRRHVASHQEQLALFSLPRATGAEDRDDGSTDRSHARSRSIFSYQENLEENVDPKTENLWLSDPPLHLAFASGNLEEAERLLRDGADPDHRGETWATVLDAAQSFQPDMSTQSSTKYLAAVRDLLRIYATGYQEALLESSTLEERLQSRSLASSPSPTRTAPARIVKTSGVEATMPTLDFNEEADEFGYTNPSDLAQYDLGVPIDTTGMRYYRNVTAKPRVSRSLSPTRRRNVHGTESGFQGRAQRRARGYPTSGFQQQFAKSPASPNILAFDNRARRRSRSPRPGVDYSYPSFASGSEAFIDADEQHRSIGEVQPPASRGKGPNLSLDALGDNLSLDTIVGASNDGVSTESQGKGTDIAFKDANHPTQKDPEQPTIKKPDKDHDSRPEQPEHATTDKLRGSMGSDAEHAKSSQELRAESKRPPALKGILKQPTKQFPEEPSSTREAILITKAVGDASESLKKVPAGAKWTKIARKLVNPEALVIGKERFEVRGDFVIVLRVLTKEEIMSYAAATQQLRESRRQEVSRQTVNAWVAGDPQNEDEGELESRDRRRRMHRDRTMDEEADEADNL